MSNFNEALKNVLDVEKGFVNDLDDKGGATNMGITMSILNKWRQIHGSSAPVTVEDIEEMKLTEAAEIYEFYFWKPLNLDHIDNDGIATAMFNICVNIGQVKCARFAQKAAGIDDGDGIIGPKSITAINSCEPVDFMLKFTNQLTDYYVSVVKSDPRQQKFLNGWIARAHSLMGLVS